MSDWNSGSRGTDGGPTALSVDIPGAQTSFAWQGPVADPPPAVAWTAITRSRLTLRPAPGRPSQEQRCRQLEQRNRRLREEVNRLRRMAYADALTGLANRRLLADALQAEIARAARDNQPLALILADVDHFKQCNDRFGHPFGDRVLQHLGRLLRAHCRRGGDLAARYGGEEFALLLPGIGRRGGIAVAETLRRDVAGLRLCEPDCGQTATVTLSLGITVFRSPAPCRPSQLLRTADRALYRAKAEGRDCSRYLPAAARRCGPGTVSSPG